MATAPNPTAVPPPEPTAAAVRSGRLPGHGRPMAAETAEETASSAMAHGRPIGAVSAVTAVR